MALSTPVLVLTGAVGVGKTSGGADVSRALQARGEPHLYQDLDAIRYTFPRPENDPRGLEIIRQNLTWAVTYNLAALPLAALGFVPPWLAAIGMSLSSVVVVLNAMRLSRSAPPLKRPGMTTNPRVEAA